MLRKDKLPPQTDRRINYTGNYNFISIISLHNNSPRHHGEVKIMAKLSIHNFYELPQEQQKSIISEFGENFNPAYLTGKYSTNVVNAEVVTDEEGTLYDMRVFDPFNHVQPRRDDDRMMTDMAVYIGFDGWSDWLFDYTDPAGNDVDEIFEEYDGETQE